MLNKVVSLLSLVTCCRAEIASMLSVRCVLIQGVKLNFSFPLKICQAEISSTRIMKPD